MEQVHVKFHLVTFALIHSYFVDIFVHGKLFHESAKRTNGTIYHVKKCQQNTSESMPLLSTKSDNQFPMSIIAFVFLSALDLFSFIGDLGWGTVKKCKLIRLTNI